MLWTMWLLRTLAAVTTLTYGVMAATAATTATTARVATTLLRGQGVMKNVRSGVICVLCFDSCARSIEP